MIHYRPRIFTVLIGVMLLALAFSSCAPIIVQYEPEEGGMLAIPAYSSVEVLVNRSGLTPGNLKLPRTVRSIRSSIEADIREGYFRPGPGSARVIVNVKRLSYERENTPIHAVVNALETVGVLTFLGGAAGQTGDVSGGGGLLWIISMAIPDHKYIASTEMDLKLMATDGTLIGNYQTSQMAESKVVSEFTNGKADPTSSALGGGVVREVLQSAANDIQQRIQRDREFIVESLGGEVEEPEAAPAEEAQFVESVTERTEIPEGARVNIAVVDLEAYGISDTEVQALTNRLRVELFQTGRFAVVERDQMRAIMEEQDFQQTGCTTNECLVEVGQLLNVQQIIAGSISKVGEVFSIEVRVIDVLTGEIVNAAIVDVMGAISDVLTEGIGRAAARLAR
jgi:TolB-like protein